MIKKLFAIIVLSYSVDGNTSGKVPYAENNRIEIPKFVRAPEPFVAPLNDEVEFECALNERADLIRWKLGSRYLPTNHTSLTTSKHVVRVTDHSQLGDYQCVAWIGALALASVPAKLTLAEMNPITEPVQEKFEVTPGNTVAISCPIPTSNPPALIQYFHNDRKVALPPERSHILPTTVTLILHNVTASDSGVYTCAATNYITAQTISIPFKFTLDVVPRAVPSAPRFLTPPQTNYVTHAGSNVTIECITVGEPAPRVTWYKAGDSQSLPKNRTDLLIGGLYLRNVAASDTGHYICEMSNGIGAPVLHKVHLHVHEPPIIMRERSRTNAVEEHGNIELFCEARGSPHPHIYWVFNGETIKNDTHTSAIGGHLSLSRVQKHQTGIYQCFASNSAGTTYGASVLQVIPAQIPDSEDYEGDWGETSTKIPAHSHGHNHGKKEHQRKNKPKRKHKDNDMMVPPSKPNVTRLNDRSVMVRWHVPPNSGLPILFFKVQYREVGSSDGVASGRLKAVGSRWMTSNEDIAPHIRSYEVDRLEPNSYYRFRVAAVYSNNDNKLSPNSNKFYLHQGAPTDRSHLLPPTLIGAESPTPTSIEIHWQYLNSVLTPVDGFYIYYRPSSNAGDYIKATVESEKTRSFVITYLQPATSYDIKIQSFTTGAASDFSSIMTYKTSPDPNAITTTETPVTRPEVIVGGNEVGILSSSNSNTTQLLIIFGSVIGALFLIFTIFVLVCFVRSRAATDADHNDKEAVPDDNNGSRDHVLSVCPIEQIPKNHHRNHFPLHNGNGKVMNDLNGSLRSNHTLRRNGYAIPAPINITSNPLALNGKHQKTMLEMTYLSRNNNNCIPDGCMEAEHTESEKCHADRIRKKMLREHKPGENYV